MYAYLINLDKHTERLAFMQAQFRSLGIQFERIPAVDASNLESDFILKHVRPEGAWMKHKDIVFHRSVNGEIIVPSPILGRYITAGEIGCYLSHMNAISAFLDSGRPWACIFEDDVALDPDSVPIMDEIAPRIGDAIVKLEGLAPYDIDIGRKIIDVGGRSVRFRFKPSTGAAAYLLTRSAGIKLLATLQPIREPYDSWLRQYWRHGIPVYEVSPFSAKQVTTFTSSIADRRDQPIVKYAPFARAVLGPIKLWYKTLRVLRRLMFFLGLGGVF